LNEIRRFAHGFSSVTESTIHKLPSVSKGKHERLEGPAPDGQHLVAASAEFQEAAAV